MTNVNGSLVGGARAPLSAGGRAAGSSSGVALWLWGAAIVAPVFYFSFFPLVGLGALAGIAALVLTLRARRRGQRSVVLGLVSVLGMIGVVVDIVLVVTALMALAALSLTEVQVQAEGGPAFTVTYGVGSQEYTAEWITSGFKGFNTKESSAEITVTPPPGGPLHTHSCRILWDGVVVSEESSDVGPVTCHYEK